MSIYGSTFTAGDPEDPDSIGVVLIRDGGRNDWPNPDTFPGASLDGAYIPAWCVPGHDDTEVEGYYEPGPWYRLTGFPGEQYLLDEDAARTLRDDLTRWLDLPKTRPTTSRSHQQPQKGTTA